MINDNTGISHSTVNYIVNGRTPIENCTGQTLYKISKFLNISMDQLYKINHHFTL